MGTNNFTGVVRIELASPESRSGALTIMLNANNCNGENRTLITNPRITVADLSAIREADVPKGTQGFLPLKDITIVGNRRFPTRVSAVLGTRTRTSR